MNKKIFSIFIVILLVVNLILRGLNIITDLAFWIVIGVGAVSSFAMNKIVK